LLSLTLELFFKIGSSNLTFKQLINNQLVINQIKVIIIKK
jgi:hypothetical protein